MRAHSLTGGFANPAFEAAHAFRGVMEAMARPGTVHTVSGAEPPAPLSKAAGSVLLTLCDMDTPVYLAGGADNDAVREWLAFHTGAPLVGPARCMFAIGSWDALSPLSSYPIGTAQYPDRSATLIIECKTLGTSGATLKANGLVETDIIMPISARLIVNRAAYKMRSADLVPLVEAFRAAVGVKDAA